MIRIAAINGSPKPAESLSGKLIEKLEGFLGAKIDTYHAAKLIRKEDAAGEIAGILKADVLLIVFPLYVDSLPAPLIRLLTLIEQAAKASEVPLPMVYAVCNCGFYEAGHNALALRMVRAFARRAGLRYGYGLGIGCGGVLAHMEKGPAKNVYAALYALGSSACGRSPKEGEDVLLAPKIPRFLYRLGGNFGWRQLAKKNGVWKRMKMRPHNKI